MHNQTSTLLLYSPGPTTPPDHDNTALSTHTVSNETLLDHMFATLFMCTDKILQIMHQNIFGLSGLLRAQLDSFLFLGILMHKEVNQWHRFQKLDHLCNWTQASEGLAFTRTDWENVNPINLELRPASLKTIGNHPPNIQRVHSYKQLNNKFLLLPYCST